MLYGAFSGSDWSLCLIVGMVLVVVRLYKGNIFHGSISLDQIGWNRPVKEMMGNYHTPLKGLMMCGSGAHPGGGVMGAPGRNCANVIKRELKLK